MSDWITALSTYSSTREKVLEHRFISDVTAELWRRRVFDFAVSHSEVDNSGYDLIIEACGTVRHIQLKAMQVAGARRHFDLQTRLTKKQSAAAVLMLHDPVTLSIEQYRLFAGAPGEPLPSLGDRSVYKTKGDATGYKAAKPAFRAVPLSRFVPVGDVPTLVDRLFGPPDDALAAVFG
ncbi:MAG: hypothetical protein ACRYFW_15515 [Janthinobacterium lividum]